MRRRRPPSWRRCRARATVSSPRLKVVSGVAAAGKSPSLARCQRQHVTPGPPALWSGHAGPHVRDDLLAGLALVVAVSGFAAWAWLAASRRQRESSLAVLPFENLGSDPDRAYLGGGSHRRNQRVARADRSRAPERQRPHHSLQGHDEEPSPRIGQELSVDYLVGGSIRAEGTRLRVTSALIHVRDQEHVWSRVVRT